MRKWRYLVVILLAFLLAACKTNRDDGGRFWSPDDVGIADDPWMIQGTGAAGVREVTSAKIAFNPLTGISNMAEDRVGMRPIGVSVNNITDSLPQFGTSKADYILEIETEGGITRMMCMYSDTREIEKIGSLRSLRDQFIEALYPLDPLIIHFGTSIYADAVLMRYNLRMLDAMFITPAVFTDQDRLALGYSREHTKFTSGGSIEKGIESANITRTTTSKQTAFNFVDENAPRVIPDEGTASVVYYYFSNAGTYSYDGDFRYDEATKTYKKWQHGNPQLDVAYDIQLSFDNVILLFADIQLIPGQREGLVKVDYSKGGKGYYFTNGHYRTFTWQKNDFINDFSFIGADGKELEINVGKTHMGIIRNEYNDESFVITP